MDRSRLSMKARRPTRPSEETDATENWEVNLTKLTSGITYYVQHLIGSFR